jgi:polysaccharide biosynthesis transport protein
MEKLPAHAIVPQIPYGVLTPPGLRSPHPAMPAPKDEFDVRKLLAIARRRWLVIGGVALAVMAYSIATTLMEKPMYQGRFRMLVEPVNSSALETPGLSNNNNNNSSQSTLDYDTQIQVLQSPELLLSTVKQLQKTYPEIDYGMISGGLAIGRVGKTRILDVSYKGSDSGKIQAILNQLAKDYLKYSSDQRQTALRQGIQFVEKQVARSQDTVDELQKRLQVFRQTNAFTNPDGKSEQITSQITQLNQELQKIDQELAQTNYALSSLQDEKGITATLAASQNYQQLKGQLKQLEAQIALELTRFKENSLNIQLLRQKQANLMPLLEKEIREVLGAKEAATVTQIRSLQVRRQAIAETKADLEQQFQQLPGLSRNYTDLQRELQIATDSLNRLLVTRQNLQIEAAQKEATWQIVEPPAVPQIPISPNIQRNVLMGVLMGLGVGIAVALLLEKLDNTYRTVEDLKEKLQLPVLGNIPLHNQLQPTESKLSSAGLLSREQLSDAATSDAVNGDRLQSPAYEFSPFEEALRMLCTNIQMMQTNHPVRSLVISSALAEDGKSLVALNLALTAVEMGQRVLLVDTDFRRSLNSPQAAQTPVQGLSNVLSGQMKLRDAIQKSPGKANFFFLPAGQILVDPIRLLASDTMHRLMEQFTKEFDLVIYDAAPLSGLADASLLASHTDGILLVVRLNKTDRLTLTQVLENLKLSQTPILGVVANGI